MTGASRRQGLGAAIAIALAASGWDVAFTHWSPYDQAMRWGPDAEGPAQIEQRVRSAGVRVLSIEADLGDPEAHPTIFDEVEASLGPVSGLIINHCECRPTGVLDTTLESFERHIAVNLVGSWLLIREFGRRFQPGGRGRIVSLTSDHTIGNVPYGVTKGAADRLTLAAAGELAHLGVTANVVNPGPSDTGWMTQEVRSAAELATPLGRVGEPTDVANLIAFLCSSKGDWITGQLLHSNGGFRMTIE